MPQTVQMVAVHYANRSGRGKAPLFVPIEAAREMVDARLAVWNKKATYINLTKTEAEISRADRSLTMGPDVIFANACGEADAMALVAAWRTDILVGDAGDPYQEAA